MAREQIKKKNNTSALILAGFVLVFWSGAASAFKIALRILRPFELLFIATIISFLILSLIMFLSGKFRSLIALPGKDIFRLMIAGMFNPVFYYLILFKAYELLPAQFAQAINFTWPLVLALFTMILGREKFHVLRILALCISFAGVLVLVLGGRSFPGGLSLPGILLAFFSTFFWVFYWMTARNVQADAVVSLWVPFTTATIVLLVPACFLFRPAGLDSGTLIATAYVGLFEMSITFLLWLKALRKTASTALIGNFIYAVPFLSLVFIRFFLKEQVLLTTVIALLLIAGGILAQLFLHMGKFSVGNRSE
ncbi:MAG: DMT family transporter [FCB group bacterium]|nr:DMT family transporter [FCB group bacterium]